jgi:putative CocE/NonD family hydrolase
MKRSEFVAVVIALGLGAAPARPQLPEAGKYSTEQYSVKASRGHRVVMRDGVRLSADLYQPAAPGRYPALLLHTPYNNNTVGSIQRAEWFVRRGYAVVLSDSRGRYDSEGDWDPFDAKHKTDGHDLVEWMAKQPWCSGKVGMMGGSYSGWTQWWTATQAPPSLKAIAPEVAPPDAFANAPYQNGVLDGWVMDWASMMAGRTTQTVGEGPYSGFARSRVQDMMHLPYADLLAYRGALDAPWFSKWIGNNLSTTAYWRAISYQSQENYAHVTVPSLNVTGWFDANFPGSPMNYEGMKRFGATPAARHPRLIIGPWTHGINATRKLLTFDYGEHALIDWNGIVCRWFDHYLKGIDNGVPNDPPVSIFVMGANRWRTAADWPLPRTHWTKYYLHSQGQANSENGSGSLSATPPGDETSDSYIYDPAHPTLSPATANGHIDGPMDTRPSARGQDVLVYATAPLTDDIEVIGPIAAKLYAATSARDTDWMVRLVDVAPDGYAALLCDGVLRARCRDPQHDGVFTSERLTAIEPNQVYSYTIKFWRATANLFRKGHRLRVEISSSYFPYYLRNLNTGADNVGMETSWLTARQKILHDAHYPSHVILPIIDSQK